MNLNILWFILVGVLYTAFFFLEGFDFGVGILLPFLGKNDTERRAIINTIGPHWDGNEVWLIAAGGATFAAFPVWYATMFSGFYPALFLLLLALILRGVSFEFRSKDANQKWRNMWDWMAFLGSLVSALLLGVAFANLAMGVPINKAGMYTGNLWTLLNPYGLIGGLCAIVGFALYGAYFLNLKTMGELMDRAQATARKLWPPVSILYLILLVATYFFTDINTKTWLVRVAPVLAFMALLLAGWFGSKSRHGYAFAFMGVSIALTVISCFLIMYPNVMISSTDPAYSLTIYNASSTPYTLTIMSVVAAIFVPVIVVYQAWSYWIFRKRITASPEELTY
jgi:cytochrome d ubiquinol oxidase subunit II